MARRLLLFLPTTTYRTEAYVDAADRLRLDLTVVTAEPLALADRAPASHLCADLRDHRGLADAVRSFADRWSVDGVFGVDDETAVAAAAAADALGLPHNSVEAVEAARNKHAQRVACRDAGVPVPEFTLMAPSDVRDPTSDAAVARISDVGARISYPLVVKPLVLSASRGVIRADDAEALARALRRVRAILEAPDVTVGPEEQAALVERYVPGSEFALDGLVRDGRLRVLALWDKPDPLDGPYFAETIYVTPSRAPMHVQAELAACAQRAIDALGLVRGPVHVELRYNDAGPWLIELAARPIGGKCGQALRFGAAGDRSLEEVLLADALEMLDAVPPLTAGGAGVMMLAVPRAGAFDGIRGIERAEAVPGVTGVVVSAHVGQRVVPLPDESRYLGFVFARGPDAAAVEAALRSAGACVDVRVHPAPD